MTRTVMRTNGKTSTQMGIEVAACFTLRLTGMTMQQISDALAQRNPPIIITRQVVSDRLQSEINMKVQPLAAEARAYELARLDRHLVQLDVACEAGDVKAINTALRVGERRAKLLGLDAPAQSESLTVSVTAAGSELAELIRAAQQRQLAKEAFIIEGEVIEQDGTLQSKGGSLE